MSLLNKLSIGTYQIHGDVEPILHTAWMSGCYNIDTAPNYRDGKAQEEIKQALQNFSYSSLKNITSKVKISTKIGFIPFNHKEKLKESNVILSEDTYHSHNLSSKYLRYQLERNFDELGLENLEYIFVHNPEVQLNHKSKTEVINQVKEAFEILEEVAVNYKIKGYGISTWTGFGTENQETLFTVQELYNLAQEIAGEKHHFKSIQLPLSLVNNYPLKETIYHQRGPLWEAEQLEIEVHASSPLHGGKLPKIVSKELSELIGEDLSSAQSCLLFSLSHSSVKRVLTSPSNLQQLQDSLKIDNYLPLNSNQINKIINIISEKP